MEEGRLLLPKQVRQKSGRDIPFSSRSLARCLEIINILNENIEGLNKDEIERMGKGIDSLKLKKRSEKLAFMEVKIGSTSSYCRLEGFTTQAFNANASEYNRQYVDEDTERTDVKGYSESINYNFDQYIGHPALSEIVKITENELTGTDAVRNILTVDMTSNTSNGQYEATLRAYAIVPSSNGDTTDCMTYSGDFKSRGAKKAVKVTLDADFENATIVGGSAVASQSAENVEVKK